MRPLRLRSFGSHAFNHPRRRFLSGSVKPGAIALAVVPDAFLLYEAERGVGPAHVRSFDAFPGHLVRHPVQASALLEAGNRSDPGGLKALEELQEGRAALRGTIDRRTQPGDIDGRPIGRLFS